MVKPVFRRKSIGTKVSEEEYARLEALAEGRAQQVNNMISAGAADPAEAAPVLADVTALGAAAVAAAPLVSKYAPYAILGTADAFLLKGVIKETQAGLNGKCSW